MVRRKRLILGAGLGLALLGAVVSLLLPSRYTASTSILPPQQSNSCSAALLSQLSGGLGSVASLAGGSLGLKNPNDLRVALLKSRTVVLLINGLDLMLVGRFEFKAVIPYSVAAGVIPFLGGSLYAILNAMMPQATALHAQAKNVELGQTVISSTRISLLLLVFTGAPLLIYAGPILRVWIGNQYEASGRSVLVVLLVANMIRLVGAAYSIVLVAAGQQRLIKVSPAAEGLTNLLTSVLMGATLGALGVAYGTLVGAFVSVTSHLLYSMPRTMEAISFSRQDYLLRGILFPLMTTSPLLLVAGMSIARMQVSFTLVLTSALLSAAASALLLKRYHGFTNRLYAAPHS